MRLPEFLTKDHGYRGLTMACGLILLVCGLAIGFDHGFSDWLGGMFSIGLGIACIAAGFFLSERMLMLLGNLVILINILAAVFALISGN